MRKRMICILTTLCTMLFAPAHAQMPTFVDRNAQVELIRYVELIIDDQAVDGCWTNASAVANKIRLLFESNNIPVYTEPLFDNDASSPNLYVTVLAQRDSRGICFGFHQLILTYQAYGRYGGTETVPEQYRLVQIVLMWERTGTVINGGNLNEFMISHADEAISGLIADIYAARRIQAVQDFVRYFPGRTPMTEADWERMVESIESESAEGTGSGSDVDDSP